MFSFTIDKSDFSQYIKDLIIEKGRANDQCFDYAKIEKIIFNKQEDGYYILYIYYYDYWDGEMHFELNVDNLNRGQYNSICNFIVYLLCNKQKNLMKEYNELNINGQEIMNHLKKINTLIKQDRRI